MKQRKWIALLLAVAVLLSLAACSTEKKEKEEQDISGFYALASATLDGEAVDAETLAWNDYALFVWLKEDGDVVFFNGTALIYGTWKDGKIITDTQKLSFSVDGETLAMTTVEGELIFKRSDKEIDLDELQTALDTPPEIGYFLFESSQKEDFSGEDAFVLLNADGTGYICNGKKLLAVTWKDGELFESESGEKFYDYTVIGDELVLAYGTETITFCRTDEAEPDIEELKAALADPNGYFVLTSITYGDTTISMADLADFYEVMPFLLLNEDGTGTYYDGMTLYDLTWDDEKIYVSGEAIAYTFDATVLRMEEDDMAMVFEHSDEEAPDVEAISSGDLVGSYYLYMGEINGEETYDLMDATLTLSEDGSVTYTLEDGTEMTGTWDDTSIVVGTGTYSYSIGVNGSLTLTGSDGIFYFLPGDAPVVDQTSFWTGGWYGWWIIEEASGDYAEYRYISWDLCAYSEDYGDYCTILLWDEADGSIYEPTGAMTFTHGETTFTSDYGWFWVDEWYGDKELTCDLSKSYASDMLILSSSYADEYGSFIYSICLRPWGVKWDDVDEDIRPYHYETWYLPLIEAGESLPDTFEP